MAAVWLSSCSQTNLWLDPACDVNQNEYCFSVRVYRKKSRLSKFEQAVGQPRYPGPRMVGDFKKHGFDLEGTMLRQFDRLSRLTLGVVLLYVWLISIDTRTIRDGLRNLVDRADRRDLSIFQIGLRFTERCVTNAFPFQITLCSYR